MNQRTFAELVRNIQNSKPNSVGIHGAYEYIDTLLDDYGNIELLARLINEDILAAMESNASKRPIWLLNLASNKLGRVTTETLWKDKENGGQEQD